MTAYQYPNYLAHHGVKGMKWGVRKKYKPHPRDYKYNKEYSSDEEAAAAKKAKRKKNTCDWSRSHRWAFSNIWFV